MKTNKLVEGIAAALFGCCLCGCSSNESVENIARNRAVCASSNYDYNLTAQLVTDGVIETSEPAWVKVRTAKGELPRRERLWTIDAGPYSFNRLEGCGDFLEYEWSAQSFTAGCVRIRGHIAFSGGQFGDWMLRCYASSAGTGGMKLVGTVFGKGLPGKMRKKFETVSDPNKQSEQISLPTCEMNLEIPLSGAEDFSRFRVEFDFPDAALLAVKSVDFPAGRHFGKNRDTGPFDSKESRGICVLPSEVFSSVWMSEDGSPQWLRIDLGSKRKFNGIRLHWIHKPSSGRIEISNDAKSWKKIAELPQTDSLTFSVAASGRARYLRLSIEGADGSGHFALSEMEVSGPAAAVKPSVKPSAKPGAESSVKPSVESSVKPGAASDAETARRAEAAGNAERSGWKLRRASPDSGSGEQISSPGYDDSLWLPAVVPGTVLYSYIAAGAVPDPAIADNNLQISESFFNSDFWYRWTPSDSEVAQLLGSLDREKGERAVICFDGINWKAEVYVNGKYAGNIAGAFRRAGFDVTDLLRDSGNAVAVRIIKNAHYGAAKEKNAESPDFNGGQLGADNPTFHASIGWDWMPTVRGRNTGIWNDVRLEKKAAVSLSDPLVSSRIIDGLASVTLSVKVENSSPREMSGVLQGRLSGIAFSGNLTLKAGESRTVLFSPDEYPQLKDRKIALWWPNGYGEPALHDASFSFVPEGSDRAVSSVSWRAGIREFSYADEMTSLKMFINGRRLFPKGGNWGFSEYNLRFGAAEYDTAVRMHRDMNLNMIRNWVGQTGDEEFYEACDRYGIVVWQDFWLANPADGPDPDDSGMFLDNARDYVSLIRRHPCIGLYCGRNEGCPPAEINAGLEKTVAELHPDILYIPNSADGGVSGHGPYRAVEPAFYFENPTSKFHSERGMPAVMEYESLSQMLTEQHLWPFDDVWGQHDFTRTGAQGDAAFIGLVRGRFGDKALESAEKFARYAQWINYDGYRAMYEANNVERHGLLIWMSHSAWPSLAWQTYDYWFRPTAACAAVKKACEPLHIQLNPAACRVEVVNVSGEDLKNLSACISAVNPDGQPLYSQSAVLSPVDDSTAPAIDISDIPDGLCIVTLSLKSADGKILSENRYFRNFRSGKDCGDYRALVGTHWLERSPALDF